MKVVVIMQPSYIPWVGFFELMMRANVFLVYDIVTFDKNGWRNRNRIKTADGPLWLTVPVHSKGSPRLCEILIDNDINWSAKHLKSIELNYKKSKYFEEYFEEVKRILNKKHVYLNELNLEMLRFLARAFDIDCQLFKVSELKNINNLERLNKVERLVAMCKQFDGDTFYEPIGGKNYIEPELKKFEDAGIKVVFQDILSHPYPQLYGEFIPNLSALDLLFNKGKDGKEIILKSVARISL